MDENNKMALMAAAMIRSVMQDVEVYCPAEHEDFVCKAYFGDMLTEKQILDIDCAIIDDCDMVLYFNHQKTFSNGMKREYQHAGLNRKMGVTVNTFAELRNFVLANANRRTFNV